MEISGIIGGAAAVLTTIAFVPQAWKLIKTKHTKDLSFWMYLIFTTGVALWLTYGLMEMLIPVIVANLITFILAFIILVYKIIYK